jgi:UDP-N-acetylglucosamine--N-acetylmuramyl-(pentapeptide) pyrophosphoryl-undecaprenol N-acetylglucosamine transferase
MQLAKPGTPDDERGRPVRCLIAGGGTGGHLFPGIAVAREFERRFRTVKVLFVTGHKKIESEILAQYGYRAASIDVEGLKGRAPRKALVALIKLPKALFQSATLIKDFAPDLVFGVGGYSAGPVCAAAKLLGIPTAIHEQNSFPGLTNRLLSRFVDRVFISFEDSTTHLKRQEFVLTGNPVREELFEVRGLKPGEHQGFTILVMGGSQGAKAINRVFINTLAYLNSTGKYPKVIHQTGQADYEEVLKEYRDRGLRGEISPFIKDMSMAYKRADMVVSRAGASTIFELAALGKPSILIPYPYAANQHQDTNALALVRVGGAEMISQVNLTGEGLGLILKKYMEDRSALEKMGARAATMGRRDAAGVIVDEMSKMIRA